MGEPNATLRTFYQALGDRPLDPSDAWYVQLYNDEALATSDPIEQLATGIEWSLLESTHLFTGFRGTGKTTELRRLKARLEQDPRYRVVLCDMLHYLSMSTPVDITEFLIGLAGSLSDALAEDPDLLGAHPMHEGYWTRVVSFLRDTDIELAGVDQRVGAVGAGLKATIRQDPTFRQRLRKAMEGRLGMLVADVHRFFADCVQALRSVHGDDIELVVLFDSVEQIRGTSSTDAERVYASVEALFINYAESLQFEEVHVVYTVPPWLKVRSPGIAGDYDGLQMLPCVRVRNRDGSRCEAGIEALRRVVERRGDWAAVLGTVEALDTIVLASGGYLRDLFRLLQAVLRHARGGELPVGEDTLQLAIHEVRNGYLPIARTDALWLAKVAESHRTELIGHRQADHPTHNLYNLSRFFDYHMVLGYWEDEAWYDVHPLLRDEVRRQAEHA